MLEICWRLDSLFFVVVDIDALLAMRAGRVPKRLVTLARNRAAQLFALQLLRAVPVAFNHDLPPALIAKRIGAFRLPMTVSDEANIGALNEAGAEPVAIASLVAESGEMLPASGAPGPDDLAHVQITSGTTGRSPA